MLRYATLIAALLALATSASIYAQSDPSNFDTVINVPGDPVPSQIGSNTQLNLSEWGSLPEDFSAGYEGGTNTQIEVNILGGIVGDDFVSYNSLVNIQAGTLGDFFAYSGSIINFNGGILDGDFLHFNANTQVNIAGGHIDARVSARSGSQVLMTGGTLLGGNFGIRAYEQSHFRILGGKLGRGFVAEDYSTIELSGGTVGRKFVILDRSDAKIVGDEFLLNGSPYLDSTITLASGDIFTGTLSDGSPFLFTTLDDDRLDDVVLMNVAPPTLDTNPIVIDSSNPVAPNGLRVGQNLTLREGGRLARDFTATNANLQVEGGTIGADLTLYNSTASLTGGYIESGELKVYGQSDLLIDGIESQAAITVFADSRVTLQSGRLATILSVQSGGVASITGGKVARWVEVASEGHTNMSGGLLAELSASAGSTVEITGGVAGRLFAPQGSDVTLTGGEFKLNGQYFEGDLLTLTPTDIFSGTLSDGSAFVLSPRSRDTIVNVAIARSSLPPIDQTPIVVDSPLAPAPSGLRPGQTLTVRDAGALNDFFAVTDATLTIEGGFVGKGLEITNSTLNVSGGTISDVRAFQGSRVEIKGGVFDPDPNETASALEAFDSNVVVEGGLFDGVFRVEGGTLSIQGGSFTSSVAMGAGATATISGGVYEKLSAGAASHVQLLGSAFQIDGAPIAGLEYGQTFEITTPFSTLSGVFADGTAFNWETSQRGPVIFYSGSTLTVTLILPGDFNGDAVVDLTDYTVWRDNLGSTASLPGDLTPGAVTQDDYDLWKNHFGEVFTPGTPVSATQVPEPNAALLLLAGFGSCLLAHGCHCWLVERC